jgi:hypothetical protein
MPRTSNPASGFTQKTLHFLQNLPRIASVGTYHHPGVEEKGCDSTHMAGWCKPEENQVAKPSGVKRGRTSESEGQMRKKVGAIKSTNARCEGHY